MIRPLIILLWTLSLVFPLTVARGATSDWLVVVNSQSSVTELSEKQVMSLFLGRSRFFPSGERVRAIDHPINSEDRAEFYQALTGKSISDIDAYWARLTYSGRATPPTPLASSEEIIQLVGNTSEAISYLPAHFETQLTENGLKPVLVVSRR